MGNNLQWVFTMRTNQDDVTPPVEPVEDKAHRLVRTVVSGSPIGGGCLVEFMNMFWVPPMDRRREKWMTDVTHDLQRLEEQQDGFIENLFEKEEFVSILNIASQQAILSHRVEKLEALRSAIRNAALGTSVSFDKQELFLRFISQFTVQHILVIEEINNLTPEVETSQKGSTNAFRSTPTIKDSCQFIVSGTEPGLQHFIVRELHDSELIVLSNETSFPMLTSLGSEFISFIKNKDSEGSR